LFDDLDDDEDFRADYTILRAELENYLALMTSDPNENFASIKTRMDKVVAKTKELIGGQKLMKGSYKAKRPAGADISVDGSELKFLRVLGQGGFATVWAGQYKNEVVAIKKINDVASCSFEDFKTEANIMRRVSHPRTVACYGVAEAEGSFCMIMEFLEHDSVFNWLAKSKYAQAHNRNDVSVPSWATKQEIILDIANGMAYLHRLRIIHRDLKSPNVLLDNSYRAKVADFGLSVVKSNTATNIKMDEAGTANYMVFSNFIIGSRMLWIECHLFHEIGCLCFFYSSLGNRRMGISFPGHR
jgi:serine/threonine protein kinase